MMELFIAGILHSAGCENVWITQDYIVYFGNRFLLEDFEGITYDKKSKFIRINTKLEWADIDLEYDLMETYDK
ncbi:hypothetical protein [Clostridium estertheticum]|uniref:hypothetical protein n=1 Tax=Clostridium estertheticum TaxID=238834 RepID=UPI00124E5484|nr:hypothetical protein [Clostridium estertheticum]WAG72485.1 hypothetical protein LL032_15170 [Clostridium estertheticum]